MEGATIKNLTVEDLGFADGATGEYGCAIVGMGSGTFERLMRTATGGNTITNTHNCAGILVNANAATTLSDCTNTVNIVRVGGDKLGGICCFVNNSATFRGCVNTGDYAIANPATLEANPGKIGFAGILGYFQGSKQIVSMQDCVNTGHFVNGLDETQYDLDSVIHGQFFGRSCYVDKTLSDLGGNKFLSSEGQLIGSTISLYTNKITDIAGAPYTINGFKYATIADGVGTTYATAAAAIAASTQASSLPVAKS